MWLDIFHGSNRNDQSSLWQFAFCLWIPVFSLAKKPEIEAFLSTAPVKPMMTHVGIVNCSTHHDHLTKKKIRDCSVFVIFPALDCVGWCEWDFPTHLGLLKALNKKTKKTWQNGHVDADCESSSRLGWCENHLVPSRFRDSKTSCRQYSHNGGDSVDCRSDIWTWYDRSDWKETSGMETRGIMSCEVYLRRR